MKIKKIKIWVFISFLITLFSLIGLSTAGEQSLGNKIYVIIRNDDQCAFSNIDKERRVLEIFAEHNIPQVFAVVPFAAEDWHDAYLDKYHPLEESPGMIALLKEYLDKGLIEVALHGFSHQTNIHHPNSVKKIYENEFYPGINRHWLARKPKRKATLSNPSGYNEFKGLPYEIQKEKVMKGKVYLERLFNIRIQTFIPPFNGIDKALLNIVKENGFDIVLAQTAFYGVKDLNIINYPLYPQKDVSMFIKVIEEAKSLNQPVLLQILYHAWMFSENQIDELKEVIATLANYDNVTFITPKQVAQIPEIREILNQKISAELWTKRANRLLKKKVILQALYILDKAYDKKIVYQSIMLISKFLLFLLLLIIFTIPVSIYFIKKIGFLKTFVLLYLAQLILSWVKGVYSYPGFGIADISITTIFIFSFLTLIFYKSGTDKKGQGFVTKLLKIKKEILK